MFEFISKAKTSILTHFDLGGYTIRKMSGEDMSEQLANLQKNGEEYYQKLLDDAPERFKKTTMYKEILNLKPEMQSGMLRLKDKGN